MYKIKLFRNMSGLVAGQSLKQIITNRDWWKGVFGNMFSTMLGIALTVGVAALVEHHNDKKLSREMMFNILKACEDNAEGVEEFDSLFSTHIEAIDKIKKVYYSTDKFKNITKAQTDSIKITMNKLTTFNHLISSHAQVDKYFYSAQMMHQFGNAKIYSDFADFVQLDRDTFEKIEKIKNMWINMMQDLQNIQDDPNKTGRDALAEIIANHELTNYMFQIRVTMLKTSAQMYKDMFTHMLKEMGATKEEFEDYKNSIDTGMNDEYNYYEKL